MSYGRKHICQAGQRRGAISVLAAFMSVMVLAMVALASIFFLLADQIISWLIQAVLNIR